MKNHILILSISIVMLVAIAASTDARSSEPSKASTKTTIWCSADDLQNKDKKDEQENVYFYYFDNDYDMDNYLKKNKSYALLSIQVDPTTLHAFNQSFRIGANTNNKRYNLSKIRLDEYINRHKKYDILWLSNGSEGRYVARNITTAEPYYCGHYPVDFAYQYVHEITIPRNSALLANASFAKINDTLLEQNFEEAFKEKIRSSSISNKICTSPQKNKVYEPYL